MRRRALAVASVALVALAACRGGDEPPAAPLGTPAVIPGTPSPATPPAGSTPPATPGDGGGLAEDDARLTVGVQEAATLDPMRIQDPASLLIARQLYEGLTRWDPVAEEVVPAAAESWEVSRGGRVFTFRLREGMRFHNGLPVTSDDFEFAFDRIADKRSASDLAYVLERVDGFGAFNRLGRGRALRGISSPGPRTLVIELTDPFYDFPAVLTHPGLVPVPEKAVKDVDEFLSSPVGNGPFMIARPWTPGDEVILSRFDDFYSAPRLDSIRFVPYPDAAASWPEFADGPLDVVEAPVDQIEPAAEEFGEDGYKPLLTGYYYGINVRSKSLESLRVRRAIGYALDREAIATRIYRGNMLPPRGIVPEGMPGFERDACGTLCDHAPRKARALLARVPRRARSIRLDFTQGEPHDAVARVVSRALKKVGFSVKVNAYRFEDYLRRLSSGRSQLFRLGWIAEYPVPDEFLSSLFGSDAPDNHSSFASPRVDRLLERAHAEESATRRLQLYRRAEGEILQRAPVIPIGSFVSHWVAKPRVEGIEFDVMGGFDAAGVSLAEE